MEFIWNWLRRNKSKEQECNEDEKAQSTVERADRKLLQVRRWSTRLAIQPPNPHRWAPGPDPQATNRGSDVQAMFEGLHSQVGKIGKWITYRSRSTLKKERVVSTNRKCKFSPLMTGQGATQEGLAVWPKRPFQGRMAFRSLLLMQGDWT